MIRFAHSDVLYLLALVPVLAAFGWLVARLRRNARNRFGSAELVERLAEPASSAKRTVRFAVLVAATALLVITLAAPRMGTRLAEVKQEGIDLFLALDVSLSMKAEDIKPNRLEKAKLEIRNLIDRLAGDRVGLIVFAGEAFTQFPLTTDYSAAHLFLDAVDVDAVPLPGTSIGSAIERGLESFDFNEKTTKVIIIITDGENTEGDAFAVAEEAAGKGVLLYTIGLGTPAGVPIPIYDAGGRQTDFKRDRLGNVVVSRLDEVALEKIAAIGKGRYFRGTTGQDELEEIYKNINALQKKEFGVRQFTDFEDRFQYFLLPAVMLLLAEAVMTEKKIPWLTRVRLLKREGEGI